LALDLTNWPRYVESRGSVELPAKRPAAIRFHRRIEVRGGNMNPERSDPSETPRRGIARFLRGEVADRFLGGVAFSAAAMPITREVNHGRGDITRDLVFGRDQITAFTDTIPEFTTTQPMTTTFPEGFSNFGRFVSDQVTSITPTITRITDVIPG
jgi:hypothetical protein